LSDLQQVGSLYCRQGRQREGDRERERERGGRRVKGRLRGAEKRCAGTPASRSHPDG